MTDTAVVGRILREYHDGEFDPAGVRRLSGSVRGAQVTYLLRRPDGYPVVVRAFRADVPLPAHLRGCGTTATVDWLTERAATLAWLAKRGYPAPTSVPTRSGDPIGLAGIWLTWATSYVEGTGGVPPGLLGEALGRLHALGRPEAGLPVGKASWYPGTAIPAALARLEAVGGLVPAGWHPLQEEFRRTLLTMAQQAAGLPMGVVHGGAWPGNAVRTRPDGVTLIDWKNAGLGLPVVDLGHALLECHLDRPPAGAAPQARLIQPDEARIAALAAGYTRWRQPLEAELALLAAAMRFPAAFAGAIHFEQALIDGVTGPPMDIRLARLRNRLTVSTAVAELARRHFAGTQKPVR